MNTRIVRRSDPQLRGREWGVMNADENPKNGCVIVHWHPLAMKIEPATCLADIATALGREPQYKARMELVPLDDIADGIDCLWEALQAEGPYTPPWEKHPQ